jgi:hypothetical protein
MPRSAQPEPQTVVITFLDDEIIEGQAEGLTFDEPSFVLQPAGEGGNNQRAVISLAALKRATLALEPISGKERTDPDDLVAVRFLDGEVLKGYLQGEIEHRRYGLRVRLVSPERDRLQTIGLPYPAFKALFYLKSWDSRPPEFNSEEGGYSKTRLSSPLVDLISDIGELEKLRKRGAISESEFQRKRRTILDKI